ncbi:MAG: exopolysaccharide biosynthesis protein [Cypionkella sp.]|nr:exopolysaccharide biosynthesis protein [Cypionkella sp.]
MNMSRHTDQSLSHALLAAVGQEGEDHIRLIDLVSRIKTRALALLLVLFSLPNILPSLPGTSAITGAPLMLLTLQMTLGRGIWLPAIVANRAIPRAGFLALLTRAQPYFDKIERMLHPRLFWVTSPIAQRILGALMLALSLIIMLPIPLANALPALAILIMAAGADRTGWLFHHCWFDSVRGRRSCAADFYGVLITLTLAQITPWF